MISQRDLRRYKNLQSKAEKARNFLNELNQRISFLKEKFISSLNNGEDIEEGARFAKLIVYEPRASVSWLKEFRKLLEKQGKDPSPIIENIKERSKEGKPKIFDVKVF